MNHVRRYQRYTVDGDSNTPAEFEVLLEGNAVRLVNFSVGDFYVLSRIPFPQGPVKCTVKFKKGGEITVPGHIVRVVKEGDLWGIAVDLSNTYDQLSVHKG